MAEIPRFNGVNPYTVPPGGVWFYQIGDDKVSSPTYDMALRRVDELLRKHGVKADAAAELARFMCPHMPAWFCSGTSAHSPVITGRMAAAKAMPFFGRPLVTSDVISARMQVCQACPKHRRDFCLHCTGYDQWIEDRFAGRRPRLPVDDASGCCSCAGTFEAVLASVDYKDGDAPFDGAPATCWRSKT